MLNKAGTHRRLPGCVCFNHGWGGGSLNLRNILMAVVRLMSHPTCVCVDPQDHIDLECAIFFFFLNICRIKRLKCFNVQSQSQPYQGLKGPLIHHRSLSPKVPSACCSCLVVILPECWSINFMNLCKDGLPARVCVIPQICCLNASSTCWIPKMNPVDRLSWRIQTVKTTIPDLMNNFYDTPTDPSVGQIRLQYRWNFKWKSRSYSQFEIVIIWVMPLLRSLKSSFREHTFLCIPF